MGSKKLVSEWRNLTYVVAWVFVKNFEKGFDSYRVFSRISFISWTYISEKKLNAYVARQNWIQPYTGHKFLFSELLVAYAYPFIYSKTKTNTLVLQNLLFVFVFVIKDIDLNTKPHMRNQNMAQLASWTSVVLWTKTCFSDTKTWTLRLFWCTTSLP